MLQGRYSEAELYSEHDYARPHQIAGRRLHGGFDAAGNYVPPRSKGRSEAIEAWTRALRERGGELFDADASLLSGPRMPTVEQQHMLLREGIGRPFWNTLTVTGKIEGRGRVLAEMQFPDLQDVVVEDISDKAVGHLNRGLLAIHGIDEGGQPELGLGGHDGMWFVARDLVFGPGAYPDVEPPESIARPEAGKRWMPEISAEHEALLSFLMNLLIIEFRKSYLPQLRTSCGQTTCSLTGARGLARQRRSSSAFARTRKFTCARCGFISASFASSRCAR
jgi:hypothetical protein